MSDAPKKQIPPDVICLALDYASSVGGGDNVIRAIVAAIMKDREYRKEPSA